MSGFDTIWEHETGRTDLKLFFWKQLFCTLGHPIFSESDFSDSFQVYSNVKLNFKATLFSIKNWNLAVFLGKFAIFLFSDPLIKVQKWSFRNMVMWGVKTFVRLQLRHWWKPQVSVTSLGWEKSKKNPKIARFQNCTKKQTKIKNGKFTQEDGQI